MEKVSNWKKAENRLSVYSNIFVIRKQNGFSNNYKYILTNYVEIGEEYICLNNID